MNGGHRLDALIITALFDELEEVLKLGDGGKSGWSRRRDSQGLPYHYREFQREGGGEPLRIAAASFGEMGGDVTAAMATALVKELDPACLAMCGICAGNKKEVALGDVIVASLVYRYDSGKITTSRDADGQREETFLPGYKTYNLKHAWRVDAEDFKRDLAWTGDLVKTRPVTLETQTRWLLRALLAHEKEGAVAPDEHPELDTLCQKFDFLWDRLRERGMLVNKKGVLALTEQGEAEALEIKRKHRKGPPKDPDFKIHVGPIATANVVQKDPELFNRLAQHNRKTLGAEMEAVAIGLVGDVLDRKAIIVKAVSDYGDGDKDDSFREFAARASAEVLIRFLCQRLMPQEQEADELDLEFPLHARAPSRRLGAQDGNDLLSRVETLTRLRVAQSGETASIRRLRVPSLPGGYLEVSSIKDGFPSIFPVAAVNELTPKVLDSFLMEVDSRYRPDNNFVRSTLVYGGPTPPAELTARARQKHIMLQSFMEYQGLIDFREYLKQQTNRLESDTVYPPWLYVQQRAVFESEANQLSTEDALAELHSWLASEHGRFVLVLGDFGTGKTFLLHELARRLGKAEGPIVPVLIKLQALEKAPRLDSLLSAHFTAAGMYNFHPPAFDYMLKEGRIALLFDGFDELALRVSYERAAEHLATLTQAAQGKAKVVISSRTQHFSSEGQVRQALGEQVTQSYGYRLARLQRFSKEQILLFLERQHKSQEAAKSRFDLLDEVKDLMGLAENPRMLGFIADIPEEKLLEAKKARGVITSAALYEEIVTQWLKYELQRVDRKGVPPGLNEKQRWVAITDLAKRLWQRTERTINIVELPQDLVEAVKALAVDRFDPEVARHQIGSGTLLVRDEEDNFSFIHQSVLEWLVAKSVAAELDEKGSSAMLAARELSPLMADFIWGLVKSERAKQWARSTVRQRAGSTAGKNARLLLDRSGEEVKGGLNLSGQDLRGEDFSGKDLNEADLTDAILTGVSLVGADLRGARLTGADLQRTDLSQARLEGADLSGANLYGARLLGVLATGATFKGADLRAAKLLEAQLSPSALGESELYGAALPGVGSVAPMVSADMWCYSIAISADSRLLAIAKGGSIHLWDLETGAELRILQGHEGPVVSVAFSPDGRTLASGSWDNTVRLWDPAQGTERRVLQGHSQSVWSVAFSPDGRTLASGSGDNTVRLWDPAQGTERRVLQGHSQSVWSVAFSPDGRTLASGALDNTVRLWDPVQGTERRVLQGHSQSVLSVAFSPDGRTLASGALDNTVRLWDPAQGTERRVLQGHSQSVWSVAFSPDGRTLASGALDNTVRLWDPAHGTERRVLQGHSQSVWSVAFSPDGRTLVSGALDNTVRLWDPVQGTERRVLQGHSQSIYCVALSPDGRTLASGSWDKTVRLWNLAHGTERRVLKGHSQSVLSVAFSPDGRTLASGSADDTVRLWDPAHGTERCVLQGHSQSVWSVAFSPDGRALASGSADNTVRLWDPAHGTERRVLQGHSQSVLSVAFSPDGRTLASGSEDNTVRLWDPAHGTERRVLQGHSQSVLSVAFSPDGRTLASGSEDNTVRLWDPAHDTERRVLQGHSQSVWSVALSPDGRALASGSEDNTVRLWDPAHGTERRVLQGHSQSVYSVAFSPDGRTLASGSLDNTVRLWNVDTGECLAILVSLAEGWVAFTPDGRYRSAGALGGAFWHVIGLCRFEPGELERYIPLRVPEGEPLYQLPR